MKKNSRLILILITILALFSLNISVFAYTPVPSTCTGYTFYSTVEPQEQTNWCWAASALNTAKKEYASVTKQQGNAVYYVKGGLVNQTATAAETALAAKYLTDFTKSFSVSGVLSYNYICISVYNQHPIILGAANAYGGHMVMIHGWGIGESNQQFVYYYDPWPGIGYRYCTYAQLLSGAQLGYPYILSVHIPY